MYKADTKELVEQNLEKLAEAWQKKYPIVVKLSCDNWHKLSMYYKCTADIRRIIYMANTIDGFHRQVRKVTKNKGVFTSDMAPLKSATQNIEKKWTQPLQNWSITPYCNYPLSLVTGKTGDVKNSPLTHLDSPSLSNWLKKILRLTSILTIKHYLVRPFSVFLMLFPLLSGRIQRFLH